MENESPPCPNCQRPLMPISYEASPELMGDSDVDPGALELEEGTLTHYCRSCQRAVRMGDPSR